MSGVARGVHQRSFSTYHLTTDSNASENENFGCHPNIDRVFDESKL
jgi:hypothetical protein